MNLLYVHESFGSLGGAEANVLITATEMQRRGHRVGLLTRRPTGRGEEAWTALFGADVFWLERDHVDGAARAFAPDVAYVHKWDDLESLEALIARGLPLVRMVHDHDLYCLRSYRYNVLTRTVCHRALSCRCVFPCLAPIQRNRGPGLPLRWASYRRKRRELALNRRFHRHLVVTPYMQHELEINGFASDKIEIFPPVPRPGDGLQPSFSDRNLLVYAGQIVRGKGVDSLLRAMARVQVPCELAILGDGNHRRTCEKLARRLGIADRVHFRGFVPQAELRHDYSEASGAVISSLWPEPIATVGLEVMRHGLPVVAFDAGGIRDWLTDGYNGFLVPWNDVGAYARRLEELLTDKARARQMGENGRRFVTEHYDFNRYLANLEDLFNRVRTEVAA